jgi:ADP-ribose pyrophosphatase YjhB (NUDIX family)
MYHPQHMDDGGRLLLVSPSVPTPLTHWHNPDRLALAVPCGAMPDVINGIAVSSWSDHPLSTAEWEALATSMPLDEPVFSAPAGKQPAAGIVIIEPDQRVWIIAPSNAFGGYKATFPKGRLEGRSLKAAALVETLEETGLRVQLTGFLTDVSRSTTYTRYYLGRRTGGNPADMGWEAQAVMLVPRAQLGDILHNTVDLTIVQSLPDRA